MRIKKHNSGVEAGISGNTQSCWLVRQLLQLRIRWTPRLLTRIVTVTITDKYWFETSDCDIPETWCHQILFGATRTPIVDSVDVFYRHQSLTESVKCRSVTVHSDWDTDWHLTDSVSDWCLSLRETENQVPRYWLTRPRDVQRPIIALADDGTEFTPRLFCHSVISLPVNHWSSSPRLADRPARRLRQCHSDAHTLRD